MAPTQLAELPDDQLAAVGRIAAQRRETDQDVVGQVAAEFNQNRGRPWREIAALLEQESHATIYRWARPFLASPDSVSTAGSQPVNPTASQPHLLEPKIEHLPLGSD